MGLFDKLFKGKSEDTFTPSNDLMNEDKFWNIISTTYKNSGGNYEQQQKELTKALQNLPLQDIILFDNRFRQLRGNAYDWQLWAAIYIIHGGCGDDSFTDFRDWVIAQGKDFYYRTLANPETLVELATEKINILWEGMGYIPRTTFEQRTGQDMPRGYRQNMEVKGTDWDEDGDDLKNMFPLLYAKYAYNFGE